MIYAVRGRLAELSENLAVVEDQAGVSWEMEISGRTSRILAADSESGTQLKIFTHLYHREDQMSLYGFADTDEKQFFLLLNKVNGIGPRQSIKLLSAASVSSLARAVMAEDEGFLTSLPGIGVKGAKKIILTLKDLVGDFVGAAGPTEARGSGVSGPEPAIAHIVDALVQMGFERRECQRVLKDLSSDGELLDSGEGEILRRAIIALS
jgi:Holliday junction DNA helicase RuvA